MKHLTFSLSCVLLVSLLSLAACSSLGQGPLPDACPAGASPVAMARTLVTVAELVCTGKPCAAKVAEVAAVVRDAEATRDAICKQWPTVEAVAREVRDPRVTSATLAASYALDCPGSSQ